MQYGTRKVYTLEPFVVDIVEPFSHIYKQASVMFCWHALDGTPSVDLNVDGTLLSDGRGVFLECVLGRREMSLDGTVGG